MKRFLFTLALIALLAGAIFADPPSDPTPPVGYVYGSQTVNTSSFTQSVGSELLTNADFSAWTGDNPDSWTVVGESGSDPAVSQVDPSGNAGSGAARIYASGATTNPIIRQSVSLTVGWWVEVAINVTASSGSTNYPTLYSSTQSLLSGSVAQSFVRVTATGIVEFRNVSAQAHDFTANSLSLRRLTPNAVASATANGTHTLTFTLPGSPVAGQRVEMRYRVTDDLNYWAARLTRNSGNTNWDFTLVSVSAGTTTTHNTSNSVGSIDAVRVMSVDNDHTAYTRSSSTWTQRGLMITNTAHNSATGLTTIYSSAITPGSLSSYSVVTPPLYTDTPPPPTITSTPLPPTATPTPTPTPSIYRYFTLEPSGQIARMAYQVTPADYATVPLLIAIFISIWSIMLLSIFLFRRSKNAP